MRFAYIDSNGNEVPIPSVDALALRIELGAIREETQLYDAQADEWGPAHTHEIFHTLSRDTAEDDGFVAPPPSVARRPDDPETTREGDPDDPGDASKKPSPGQSEAAEVPEAPSLELDSDGGEDEGSGPSLGSPNEPPPDAGESVAVAGSTSVPAGTEPEDGEDDLPYLDLEAGTEEAEGEEADAGPRSGRRDEAFDFGGLEGELEVEEHFEPPPAEEPSETGDGLPGDPHRMELETSREFDTGGYEGERESSLEFERPMSEFIPEEPPSWMDEEETGEDGVLDFSAVAPGPDVEEEEVLTPEKESVRERRKPRTSPSPPRFKKQRNLAAPMVGIVLLLAVGIGGYVAWPVVSDRLSGSPDVDELRVTIPTLSPDLMPIMREASTVALASIFDQARQAWATGNRVQEPPAQWLAGTYLAEAGSYEEVEAFWRGMGDFVDEVRGIELAAFDAALAAELQSRGIAGEDAEAIRARADSGFVAAQAEREEVFERFESLIDSALDLHRFLVTNQESIEYAPASAVTTDPVLEVNPATPEIRRAMEERLDEVTRALSSLDYRERVTATGLRSLILSRIQDRGIE